MSSVPLIPVRFKSSVSPGVVGGAGRPPTIDIFVVALGDTVKVSLPLPPFAVRETPLV